MKHSLLLAAFLSLVSIARAETGDELWQKVLSKYATCPAFSCTGAETATSSGGSSGKPHRSGKKFTIKFQRPESLLVEWTEESGALAARRGALFTRDGKVFGVPTYKPEEEPFESLADGMNAYAGISGSSTYLLPQLLIGKAGYFRKGEASLGDEVDVSGKKLREINIATPKNGNWVVTIDPETLAILRTVKTSEVTREEAETRRKEMEEQMKKLGTPMPTFPAPAAYTIVSENAFTDVTFEPELQPESFIFKP